MDTSANLTLVWPWAFVLLLLPWLLGYLARCLGWGTATQAALKLPVHQVSQQKNSWLARFKSGINPWFWVWCLLVLAAMRPEFQQPEIEIQQQRRELMLVVDVSGSMQEIMDGRTRLDHVKEVVESFVRVRSQDLIGLVVFGGQAYLYVPKTLDHQLLVQQLNAMRPGMAGPGTAIGDAVGIGLQAVGRAQGEPAILLLTDGANNAGALSPNEALGMAAQAEIRTHLIVVSLSPEPDMAAAIETTGGKVFSAFNRRELDGVYQQLDDLEPATVTERFSPATPLHPGLLLAALVLAAWRLRRSWWRSAYV
ncbi:Ca-activated chloride channel family protein [Marinospirillum celere]|uniref:Ca-activated chloride channel family protein n=1 Tax=Marinospirillum celere TaxID=1122252 RepID=A0A1I1GTH2_9GAMM|nr:VWA domain-containing protein [Marinospirillum celere]SFC13148.1 Ca-activated chloride channel family protein [Marinospirillum celere]